MFDKNFAWRSNFTNFAELSRSYISVPMTIQFGMLFLSGFIFCSECIKFFFVLPASVRINLMLYFQEDGPKLEPFYTMC